MLVGCGLLLFNTIVRIYQTNSTNRKWDELIQSQKDHLKVEKEFVVAYHKFDADITFWIKRVNKYNADKKQFLNHLKTCKHK